MRTALRTLLLTSIAWATWLIIPAHATDPGWTATGSLTAARFGHTATLLQDGIVLVVGGIGDDYSTLRSAELYDPALGTWSVIDGPHFPRSGHTATLLPDGRVLVAGGSNGQQARMTTELYDPNTGAWSPFDSLVPHCDAARGRSRAGVRWRRRLRRRSHGGNLRSGNGCVEPGWKTSFRARQPHGYPSRGWPRTRLRRHRRRLRSRLGVSGGEQSRALRPGFEHLDAGWR